MPRAKNTQKGQLGKQLMNNLKKAKHRPGKQYQEEARFIHTDNNDEIRKKQEITDLASVIDQDNLTEFLHTAKLAEKQFEGQRGIKVAKLDQGQELIYDPNFGEKEYGEDYDIQKNKLLSNLRIPRKPKWTKETTTQELHRMENEAFLSWRRGLAQVEKDYYYVHITPYERNPEVWKQLWRVIERSDILVQIVDGRDPLFYRCDDLETYVKEMGEYKQNFLLINKSDLISEEIRKQWNKYFLENNIDHMFFSAKIEQEKINNLPEEPKNSVLYDLEKSERKVMEEDFVNSHKIASRQDLILSLQNFILKQKNIKRNLKQKKNKKSSDAILEQSEEHDEEEVKKEDIEEKMKKIDNIDDEFNLDEDEQEQEQKNSQQEQFKDDDFEEIFNAPQDLKVTIGMVGYPNVGKSSVVNTLCNKKLVGVGNMPGKTKNFQTIYIQDDVILCDCPGLVFPNAGSTRAEMVCNGVLPIDRLTDYYSPIDLLCQRIPVQVFERMYNLEIGLSQITASHLLCTFGRRKGYFREKAEPDEAKSAKYILKNLINGHLIYCKLPPTYDAEKDGAIWQSNDLETIAMGQKQRERHEKLQNGEQKEEYKETLEQKQTQTKQSQLDKELFDEEIRANRDILFDNDDLIDLMDGKKVHNIKLTKGQKREIKFMIQRGEDVDFSQFLDKDQIKNYAYKVKNKNPKFC